MKGTIQGRAKMNIANRALVDLCKKLAEKEGLGLAVRVYGHQSDKQKKDCKDSKLELGFERPNLAKIKNLLDRIKPKGYTPLAYSLAQAPGDFANLKKGKRTIVLITDGLETCEGNPCQVAQELARGGMEIKLHVVGFGLKNKEMKQLKCLVKPSGGMILPAQNASELAQALDLVVKESLEPNLVITVQNSKGEPRLCHIAVYKNNESKNLELRQGPTARFSLSPGVYDVLIRDFKTSQTRRINGIKIPKGKKIQKTVMLGSGELLVTLKNTQQQPIKGYVEITLLKNNKKLGSTGTYLTGKPHLFTLVPGTYQASARVDKMGYKNIRENILIQTGEKNEITFQFGQASLEVVLEDASGKKLPAYVEVWRMEGNSKTGYKSASSKKGVVSFSLVPGDYSLKTRRMDTRVQKQAPTFKISDQEKLVKKVIFD
jgi:Ca-activated chloride channel family protein